MAEINEIEYLGYSEFAILNETVTRQMEIAGREEHMRSNKFTPYLSFIGFGLVVLTLSVNVSFKQGIEKGLDEVQAGTRKNEQRRLLGSDQES
ncbi:hypothetical protein [Paenibacillus amylolyticus]|uniref:hypothetical protein n=1 Tax=Paenibacillus amylolyticus TaxID=1451 RepID=UPI0015C3585D|nr:hypothetical protein [Paenibacillus amylolyticus]